MHQGAPSTLAALLRGEEEEEDMKGSSLLALKKRSAAPRRYHLLDPVNDSRLVGCLRGLLRLDLRLCAIGSGGVWSGGLAQALAANDHLVYLNIASNGLQSDDLLALRDALLRNRTLRALDVSNNTFGPDEVGAMLEVAEVHPSLCSLGKG